MNLQFSWRFYADGLSSISRRSVILTVVRRRFHCSQRTIDAPTRATTIFSLQRKQTRKTVVSVHTMTTEIDGLSLRRFASTAERHVLYRVSIVTGPSPRRFARPPVFVTRSFPGEFRDRRPSAAKRNFVDDVVRDGNRVGVTIQRESTTNDAELTFRNGNVIPS